MFFRKKPSKKFVLIGSGEERMIINIEKLLSVNLKKDHIFFNYEGHNQKVTMIGDEGSVEDLFTRIWDLLKS